jgi:hypothetical protein
MKRFLILFLAVLGLCVWSVKVEADCGGSATCNAFIRGDADNDGTVYADYDDPSAITLCATYGGAYCDGACNKDAYDANDDGSITTADATYLYYYFYGSSAPPSPFVSEGFDPTPDNLNRECDDRQTGYDCHLEADAGGFDTGYLSGDHDPWTSAVYSGASQVGDGALEMEFDYAINTDNYGCSRRGNWIQIPKFEMDEDTYYNPKISPALMRGSNCSGSTSREHFMGIDCELSLYSEVDSEATACEDFWYYNGMGIMARFYADTASSPAMGIDELKMCWTDGTTDYTIDVEPRAYPLIPPKCETVLHDPGDFDSDSDSFYFGVDGDDIADALCDLATPPDADDELQLKWIRLPDLQIYTALGNSGTGNIDGLSWEDDTYAEITVTMDPPQWDMGDNS